MSIFGSNEKKEENNTTFLFDTDKDTSLYISSSIPGPFSPFILKTTLGFLNKAPIDMYPFYRINM